MNDKSYRVLEYNKIKELLKNEAASSITRERIEELVPFFDIYKIKEMLAETSEAVSVIKIKGTLPLGNFYDIEGWANLAAKGAILSMKQLLEILYNLQLARNAVKFLASDDLPPLNRIKGYTEVISIKKHLEDEIDRCIISEDEMDDNASPELKRIRREIRLKNEAVRNKINSIISSAENRAMLQDAIVTMRQGRYVIPVKQEHKNRFPGIIHDQSSTGATLFIEPQSIVNMNNEMRELELAEKKEIQRILEMLSALVAESADEIINNQRILIELDYIFSKGRLAVKMDAYEPSINIEGYLNIIDGRHPLIDQDKVVPITVSIGKEYDTLVITGPNTGGKTVTLKTVGLFVMMAQSGLHIPASSGTEIAIFKQVFADIGDEQSIEQSLSTFSSHMNNIVDIVKYSDNNTLVLLDELGAGTDPTEGASLAIAILDELYNRGAKTLATTHYNELKKYAIATEGIQNASMEFDIETLSPTYKLTIGTPGRSNAFEISRKLGLPDRIIKNAKSLLEQDDIAFEEVIASIEKDRRLAENERDEAIALNLELRKQKEELEKQREKFIERKNAVLKKTKEEAREIIREAKEFSDKVQKELRELEKSYDGAERNRKLNKIRHDIKKEQDKYMDKIVMEYSSKPVKPSDLILGEQVRVLTINQEGSIISLPDEKNEVQVQVGLMKINVNLNQIEKIEDRKSQTKKGKSRFGALFHNKARTVNPTINVIGKTLDDAVVEVDKYLDDAYIAGLKEVTIIHGRGAGILREGLCEMFRTHKHVAEFRRGNYNEGGDGVTIVSLK